MPWCDVAATGKEGKHPQRMGSLHHILLHRIACERDASGESGRVGDAAVEQELVYEKLPSDIADRSVLLMDPMLGSGSSGVKAIEARSHLRRQVHTEMWIQTMAPRVGS